jgi:ATP-dependent Clp protease ATP-binding subunit ClpB
MEARITEALRASFKPEFLNRIDEVIIFHNLSPAQIGEIVDIQIKQLGTRLAENNIELVLTVPDRLNVSFKNTSKTSFRWRFSKER